MIADSFVQRFVDGYGHGHSAPALAGRAFDDLRGWVETGTRPAPGEQR